MKMDINTFMATSRRYLEATQRSDKAELREEQELMNGVDADPAASTGADYCRLGDKVKKWESGNLEIFELDNFELWICGKVKNREPGLQQGLNCFEERIL